MAVLFFVHRRNRCVPHRAVPMSVKKCPFNGVRTQVKTRSNYSKNSSPYYKLNLQIVLPVKISTWLKLLFLGLDVLKVAFKRF